MYTHTNTHVHACAHVHARAHTHTHTHTHTSCWMDLFLWRRRMQILVLSVVLNKQNFNVEFSELTLGFPELAD